jgi:hypothetical protein
MRRSRKTYKRDWRTLSAVVIAIAGIAIAANRGAAGLADKTHVTGAGAFFAMSGGLQSTAQQSILNRPLAFEANSGQAAKRVKFIARAGKSNLLLNAQSVEVASDESFGLKFVGADAASEPQGVDPLPGRRNYIVGNDRSKWHTDVLAFRRVTYRDLYPGVDLTFYGKQNEFEYDFLVKPGANPLAIRLRFQAGRTRITAAGDLILKDRGGELIQRKPIVYQEIGGQRKSIDGHYSLGRKGEVGISIGEYDHSQPLVIDPTLVYSGYLGGSGDDSGSSIAIDGSGNLYLAGTTASINFPTHAPAFPNNKGLSDIFVTKIDPTGSSVIYSTYIGGSGVDRGDGIAVDTNGNAYVVGRVDPASADFPTTPGSFGPAYHGGDFDGLVFKLNAAGNGLVYSGFLGGEENDSTEGVAVDASGVAYVTGGTKSNAFPVTVNAYQGQRAGDTDAYLTKINSSGSALLYSSYIGGSGTDRGSGVVIDGNGTAYLAGYGASPDFPTQDPFQAGFGGGFDAFIARFDTNASGLNSLVFSSYLGGSGDDKAFGIAADAGINNLYVVGQTSSNNFPVLNPAQASSGGSFDAFIAKVSNSGTKIFASYFGGSGDDRATGVAVNASGVYLTGFTSSTNLPIVSPLQLNNGGGFDAFVAKLNPGGSSILYSTYLGGSGNENFAPAVTSTNPIVVDSANAYITGYTASANFPLLAPLQAASGGGQEAFIAKIADLTPAADFGLSIAPGSRTINPGDATTFTITAAPTGGFTGSISLSATGLSADATASFAPATIAITDTSAKSSTLTINSTPSTPPGTYLLNITATSGNVQHSFAVQLVVSGANPIDAADFFVHQHYIDFLGREPDPSGDQFWINQITSCGADAQCTQVKRINVSAAFFLSIEFQQSGYYVHRVYKSAFGDLNPPVVPVPIRFSDFVRDMQQVRNGVIVGQGNWQAQFDANKQAFALAFVQRSDFIVRYPASTSATAFVNSLDANAGLVLSENERSALIAELSPNPADASLRGDVLMKVAENQTLQQKELNRAFVLMQYFGYLRRNPDDLPDSNFAGYNFWLNKLTQFNGDYIAAEMVKAFISSSEYRQRFGP